jgi:hypothetical protein
MRRKHKFPLHFSLSEISKNYIRFQSGKICTLSKLLLKNKDEGVVLGDLIRATILGTFKANERAKEICVPMVVEGNGKLFLINEDGSSKFLKDIEKPKVRLKKHFKLK